MDQGGRPEHPESVTTWEGRFPGQTAESKPKVDRKEVSAGTTKLEERTPAFVGPKRGRPERFVKNQVIREGQ